MKKQVIGKEIVDNRDVTYDCKRCDQQHIITVDFSKLSKDQREGREPVTRNAICPNTAYMYRIMNWGIDTRVSWLAAEIPQNIREETINGIKFEWGELNFDAKLERFVELDISFMGVPEEYYNLLSSVVSSHCCGYFYPAMTSAGSLGERILNRLIIKTRDYFKSSKHYKRIWDNL